MHDFIPSDRVRPVFVKKDTSLISIIYNSNIFSAQI